MSRPTTFLKNTALVWAMRLYDPADGVTLIDADSTPTVAVRKNGAAVADSVTVSKRAATTGIYDCSYNPASEVEGDQFRMEESATIGAVVYQQNWEVSVKLAEGSVIDWENIINQAATVDLSNTSISDVTLDPTVVISAAAAALDNVVEGGTVTIRRGDYTSFQLTGLGSLVGRTGEKLFFTVKTSKDNQVDDTTAIIQISETTGAIYLNNEAATAGDASLTVNDENAGVITIVMKSVFTTQLAIQTGLYYDIQMVDSSAEAVTKTDGRCQVMADVTRRLT